MNKIEQFTSWTEFGELQGISHTLFAVLITLLSVRESESMLVTVIDDKTVGDKCVVVTNIRKVTYFRPLTWVQAISHNLDPSVSAAKSKRNRFVSFDRIYATLYCFADKQLCCKSILQPLMLVSFSIISLGTDASTKLGSMTFKFTVLLQVVRNTDDIGIHTG